MRLNPFVYINETDIRFYLLVLIGIVVPSFWATSLGIYILNSICAVSISISTFISTGGLASSDIIFSFGKAMLSFGEATSVAIERIHDSFVLTLLLAILSLSFIPLLIYWFYKRYPRKIIKDTQLVAFGESSYQDENNCIENIRSEYLSTTKRPTLLIQPWDSSESPFTFGTKNNIYIGLTGGFIRKFSRNPDSFKSIMLHEIGHIANKDIEKTYLAASTFRSLLLTLLVPVVFILVGPLINFIDLLASGYDIDFLMELGAATILLAICGISIYYLLFFVIVYVFRNQIIRVREFYADARILEWEKSPQEIIESLEEFEGKPQSRFEKLRRFHPRIDERIQILKDNSRLFDPSLWVSYAVGFSFSYIVYSFVPLFMVMFSIQSVTNIQDMVARTIIAFFSFPFLMLAVSSDFHKLVLKDMIIKHKRYFSTTSALNAVKYSLVFSLGWATSIAIRGLENLPQFTLGEHLENYLQLFLTWIYNSGYFFLVLIFLIVFASMLIRRSFSRKEAMRNFLVVTVLASLLYIVNIFVALGLLENIPLIFVFFLIFSTATYCFIKIREKNLHCPNCGNKITDLSGLKLDCPKCHDNLYSWAFHSSKQS